MSDSGTNRPGSGSAGGEPPEFDWLYGKTRPDGGRPGDAGDPGDQRPPAPDRPEPTLRLPVQQPPTAYPGGPQPAAQPTPQRQPVRPTPPPVAPPPGHRPGPPRRSGWSRPGRYVKIFLALLVLWLVYLVAVPLFTWNRVDKVAFEPEGERPEDQPGTTYLVVGSDSRGNLSEEERKELGTGDASGQRTDTIMLLHTGAGPNLLVSIPRDTRVSIPGQGDDELVNAAYAYGGPRLLTRTVENLTGIRIDHYVEIGFGGFVDVVDAVGGIEICPKQAIKDPKSKLDVKKGCQEADGPTALGYSRTRATVGDDFARTQRQREVVGAIGQEAASPWSVINPLRYWNLNQAAPGAVAVGDGMNAFEALAFARAMTNTSGEGGYTCVLPTEYDGSGSVRLSNDRAEKLFDLIVEDRADDVTKRICDQKGAATG